MVLFLMVQCLAVKLPGQNSRTRMGRKVLFVKILQKSFVFLQKTACWTKGGGKFLYNSQVFREISCVFRRGLAKLGPIVSGHCQP
jgi:hypothetical protein